MSKRLFIGLELPLCSRKRLARIDPKIKGLKWLPVEQFHLTMSFLGSVDSAGVQRLTESLLKIQVPPFFLPIQGVGVFGGTRPTVVWAGVGKGHPHLFALHHHIQDAVLLAGLEADLKPFHPHITLGRAKNVSRAALLPFLRSYSEMEFDLWKAVEFTLFSSSLSEDGASYEVEKRFPLSDPSLNSKSTQ